MSALQEKERIAKVMFVLRTISGKTQSRLSKAIKVSFQQIQKYEKAQNGIPSDKLFILAKDKVGILIYYTMEIQNRCSLLYLYLSKIWLLKNFVR